VSLVTDKLTYDNLKSCILKLIHFTTFTKQDATAYTNHSLLHWC